MSFIALDPTLTTAPGPGKRRSAWPLLVIGLGVSMSVAWSGFLAYLLYNLIALLFS